MDDLIDDFKTQAIVRGLAGGVYAILATVAFFMSYFWPGVFISVMALLSGGYSLYAINIIKSLKSNPTSEDFNFSH